MNTKYIWIFLGVIALLLIAYFIYSNYQIRKAELEAKNNAQLIQIGLPPKESGFLNIVKTLGPFAMLFV